MKRIFLIVLMSVFALSTTFGQRLSDNEVIRTAANLKRSGVSDANIGSELIQRGATIDQIQRLRAQYSQQIANKNLNNSADNAIAGAENRSRVNNGESGKNEVNATNMNNANKVGVEDNDTIDVAEPIETAKRKVFGRDIFNNRRLTFEPPMNIATPQNYVLGPGDQLVIDVYGATQESLTLTISPDGDIIVPDFGPVHVSGLTVAAAQSRIRGTLGNYYSSSNIKAALGQTRTITVNVMGEVEAPGTYTLSAFATVFHALYMAGGVGDLGTLRNIKVYRQGKLITVVDIYEFILNGRLAGNVRLSDNDVIQVGAYDCIVDIDGHVKRPMAYEMREGESVSTLLRYCGGYTGDAYKKALRLLRSTGKMRSVYNVEEFEMSDFKLADGDAITVDGIYDRFENMVEIKGAVFREGMFRLGEKCNSVRTLIERAEGLTEEAMTSRAVIRRMKPNRTQEVIAVDLETILDGSQADIPLKNEDVLFIPTIAEHQNLRTLTIEGEVIFPGVYEYADNTTVEDLIVQAGGLTDIASTVKVDVSRRLRDPKALVSGMQTSETFSFALKDNLAIVGDSTFLLQPYDVVQIRKSPVFQEPMQVLVEGEVAFQGSYTLETKNQHLSDVIKAAGGVMPGAYVRGARLLRKMTDDEHARAKSVLLLARQSAEGQDSINIEQLALRTTYPVGIHLDEALANPGGEQDIELIDGDELIIPRLNRTVRISGDVRAPNTVAYVEGMSYRQYVKQAGGFGNRAKKRDTYVVYQNGTIAKANKATLEPGCEIVVPAKAPRNTSAINQWLGIGTSVASLATMFATIASIIK
ncbi:MAG: SLBB domain-containing protein [Prevotella sp.]|nr:SLBB domain-containing protein [Prevotella sp.]